jgi:hypothetical protein
VYLLLLRQQLPAEQRVTIQIAKVDGLVQNRRSVAGRIGGIHQRTISPLSKSGFSPLDIR